MLKVAALHFGDILFMTLHRVTAFILRVVTPNQDLEFVFMTVSPQFIVKVGQPFVNDNTLYFSLLTEGLVCENKFYDDSTTITCDWYYTMNCQYKLKY